MSFLDELFGASPPPTTPSASKTAPTPSTVPIKTLAPQQPVALASPAPVQKPAITGYDIAAPFIQKNEGFKPTAYLDTNGELAIGFGQQFIDGKRVTKGMRITEEQAKAMFKQEYDRRREQVSKYPNVSNMTPYMEGRFMDVIWNASPEAIQNWPKIREILESNDPKELKKLDAELLTIRKGKVGKNMQVIPALEERRKRAQKEMADK